MAYGSRVNGNYNENSDLDIFLVTEYKKFISAMLIDGIKVEMHCFPIEEVKNGIIFIDAFGDNYLKSVLKTGKVLKNEINTYEQLCNLLDYQVKRKRKLSEEVLEKLEDYISSFIFTNDKYRDRFYFMALELARQSYHTIENLSNIPVAKVYDLYTDEELAFEKYCLKLPNKDFRKFYLECLEEENRNRQKNYLLSFLKKFQVFELSSFVANGFISDKEIKQKLITMNNKVIKCESMLLKNHPYAVPFYNIIIGSIMEFAEIIDVNMDVLQYFYELAVDANSVEMKIQSLESLFCTLDEKYRIDYDDFRLVL